MKSVSAFPDPSELFSATLAYAGRGWRVFPCHTIDPGDGQCSCGNPDCQQKGKHPLTPSGCKDALADPEVIRQWWTEAPQANVAIATGADSGLWVLDCDGPEGIAALAGLESTRGPLPPTYTVATPRGGRHLYYSWPADRSIGNRARIDGHSIDCRGAGGYVLAPPSYHRAGKRYVVESAPELLPVPAPAWLVDWVSPREAQPSTNGQAHRLPPVNGHDHAAIHQRAIAYLDSCPPAVSGQGGHAKTFDVARAIVWGFDLGPEAGYELLASHYNPRCNPPWSERELRHKCEDANTRHFDKPRGWLLTDKPRTTIRMRLGAASAAAPAAVSRQVSALPPFTPFPLAVLPEPVRSFIREGAAAIGCDPCSLALPTLAVLASCIGNARRLRLNRSWGELPILWTVVVAYSGGMKSPPHNLALAPLHRLQKLRMDEHERARTAARVEQARYEAAMAAWKKSRCQGPPPEEPAMPTCSRLLVGDTTVEKLARLLQANGRGLLLERDELAGWFRSFNQYKGGIGADVAFWLSAVQGRPHMVDRVTDNQTLYVPRASVSVTGTIQPGTLARALSPEYLENGLAARLLMAWPPRRRKVWSEVELPEELHRDYGRLLDGLLSLSMAADPDGQPQPVDVGLSPQAKEAWIDFVHCWGEEQYSLDGPLAAAWAKLEAYAARLALIHHHVAHAGQDAGPVTPKSIDAGITLARWFGAEACRVYAMLAEDPEAAATRRLIELIQARGGTVTARDLQRTGRCATAEAAAAALQALANAGWGAWLPPEPTPQGGTPAHKFRLHPAPTPDTCPDARAEAAPEGEQVSGVRCRVEPEARPNQNGQEEEEAIFL